MLPATGTPGHEEEDTMGFRLAPFAALCAAALFCLSCSQAPAPPPPGNPAAQTAAAASQGKPLGKAPTSFDAEAPIGTKATCPVMGNELTVAADTPRSQYKGKWYYFCCPGCKPQFDADPEKFAGK
jgi:YHS domain-containing protein